MHHAGAYMERAKMKRDDAWWGSFWPQAMVASPRDRLVACIGAGLGLIATEWISRQMLGSVNPWFIAPMGASALLLFAMPASPLAQPWSIVGGNLVASLIGVTCAHWIDSPALAAGLAMALSIGLMFQLRCLHPPSGAVALTAVMGGPAITQLGYGFVVAPVLLNSLALTLLAVLINRLANRHYPHRVAHPPGHATADLPPGQRVGVSRADLHAVLAERGEVLDISEDDLQDILLQAEMRVYRHRFGELRCADFMARDVVTIDPDISCLEALQALQRHRVSALPVAKPFGELLGIVTSLDLLLPQDHSLTAPADRSIKVREAMTTAVVTARPDDRIEQLVPAFSDGGLHHMPVLDEARRVVGMVTQADLIAALFHASAHAMRPRGPDRRAQQPVNPGLPG